MERGLELLVAGVVVYFLIGVGSFLYLGPSDFYEPDPPLGPQPIEPEYNYTSNDAPVHTNSSSVHIDDPDAGMVILENASFSRGEDITVEFKPIDTSTGNDIKINFGLQDSENYYSIRMDEAGTREFSLTRTVDGEESVVRSAVIEPETGEWNTVNINWAEEGTISVKLDGEKVLEAEDLTYSGGKIGYEQWGRSPDTHFRLETDAS